MGAMSQFLHDGATENAEAHKDRQPKRDVGKGEPNCFGIEEFGQVHLRG